MTEFAKFYNLLESIGYTMDIWNIFHNERLGYGAFLPEKDGFGFTISPKKSGVTLITIRINNANYSRLTCEKACKLLHDKLGYNFN